MNVLTLLEPSTDNLAANTRIPLRVIPIQHTCARQADVARLEHQTRSQVGVQVLRTRLERYYGAVTSQLVISGDQLAAELRNAPPPTRDDVPVTTDGRRLDSVEAVLNFLAEIAGEVEQPVDRHC